MQEVLIEQRMGRSLWGWLWLGLLILVTALAVFEILRLFVLESRLAQDSSPIARLVIRSATRDALVKTIILWGIIALPLAVATYLTRGRRVLVAADALPERRGPSVERTLVAIIQIISLALLVGLYVLVDGDRSVMRAALTYYWWTIPVCIALLLLERWGPRSSR